MRRLSPHRIGQQTNRPSSEPSGAPPLAPAVPFSSALRQASAPPLLLHPPLAPDPASPAAFAPDPATADQIEAGTTVTRSRGAGGWQATSGEEAALAEETAQAEEGSGTWRRAAQARACGPSAYVAKERRRARRDGGTHAHDGVVGSRSGDATPLLILILSSAPPLLLPSPARDATHGAGGAANGAGMAQVRAHTRLQRGRASSGSVRDTCVRGTCERGRDGARDNGFMDASLGWNRLLEIATVAGASQQLFTRVIRPFAM